MATAISLEIDEADMEEATITTTWAADDGGEDEDEVKNRPANMLLKVKCSWDILKTKSHDSQINKKGPLATRACNAMDKKKMPATASQSLGKNPNNLTGRWI